LKGAHKITYRETNPTEHSGAKKRGEISNNALY